MQKPLVELATIAYSRGFRVGQSTAMVVFSGLLAIAYVGAGEPIWAAIQWFFFLFFVREGWKARKAHKEGMKILKGEKE